MVSLFTLIVQPCGIVSLVFSISVVVSVLLFQKMIRGKIFMKIVALISLCDAMGNWPYALSYYPSNGTALCSFEGFCNLYFFPCSWLFTTFLMKLFRDLVISGKIFVPLRTVVSVSMGLPLLFTLLQLAMGTYGAVDDAQEGQPCSYGGDANVGFIWHMATYDGLLYLCLLIMLLYLAEVLWMEVNNRIPRNTEAYLLMRRVLILYPIALLICWIPHAICICVSSCYESLNNQAYVDSIKILHGTCVALIFYTMSNEARQQWTDLFRRTMVALGIYSLPRHTPDASMWATEGFRDTTDVSSPLRSHHVTDSLPDDEQLAAMLCRTSEEDLAIDAMSTEIARSVAGACLTELNSHFR
jgi:hypothetical protein